MSKLIDNSRIFISAFGFVAAVAYGIAASRLSIPAFSDPVGPRLFPYMVATGLCLASLALIAEHFAIRRTADVTETDGEEPDGVAKVAFVALSMLAVYYMVFDYLGFLLATALFLIVFLSYSNRGQLTVNLLVALLFPIAAYLLLDTAFGARLPDGILDFG
ncbi:tripartite tricarboxylate transporter TctB family protein [Rhizobium sp. 1AS11]|uniref:tripartite tricarboxylate transporter TctB family protein n=1 Tax=Rhizobium acaciae TaxID=2989736 RepID=UPI002223B98E|nr:tripartite tricarboxylate transporter TctB family protein [Rhizobium acaciae]MCW1411271.1 tripartite tricarboxylate transporter TctB family protein [Rhizobium acaciae]MCW1743317.1 tripartite tricarboxylate transporter TctB family protein [Rhizobium acaciae]